MCVSALFASAQAAVSVASIAVGLDYENLTNVISYLLTIMESDSVSGPNEICPEGAVNNS